MNTAVRVTLPGDLVVAVPSLPAQLLSKLFAWQYRHNVDRRGVIHDYHEGKYLDDLDTSHQTQIETTLTGRRQPNRAGGQSVDSQRELWPRHSPAGLSDLLAADTGGVVPENRSLLAAYRQGFA